MKASERSVVNGDRSDSEGVKDIARKLTERAAELEGEAGRARQKKIAGGANVRSKGENWAEKSAARGGA